MESHFKESENRFVRSFNRTILEWKPLLCHLRKVCHHAFNRTILEWKFDTHIRFRADMRFF